MAAPRLYLVSGSFKLKNGETVKFKKYVTATKPYEAVQKVFELIGSNHKVKRGQIRIDRVEEAPIDEAPDEIKALVYIDRIIAY
ncbi:50S ribosomal protein L18Ae [Thermoproteus tenax]|uniref:Large ribosomal subunit protein eL20 n=1 Tax=Thermoproteus tenax (strain ATCC 35583 / DSM 2078 / JCM 9277 / NBRC 100435 / Kra 1) TaxID=768679 RepID=G4RLI7_THETK|nr:50S ribosomal protein L18Ae [Thermoproteus tenax]CCC82432.1 putative 50S ribosomal protein LXa [Thermoproteus tenax Kra 1]